MAILRSNHKHKAFHVFGLLSLLLLIQRGGAYEFKVGGSNGWTVPTDSNSFSYNQWAEMNRFQIGDSIIFDYPANKDSVVQVTKDDYANCNTANPIATYTDGHTVFKFDQSGPFYFVSGLKENCVKNEKMVVIVMADRSNRSSNSNQTTVASPPPSGSTETTPSPAPSGEEYPSPPAGIVPSPAPSTEQTPPPSGASSPPEGSVETIPSPAPSTEESPPRSGASSIVMSFIGSVGAFLGSSLLLVF